MKVYKAINRVQSDLAKTGITKSRTNTQGASYKFRGIDDVFNALSPLMAEHGLCVLPRVIERECIERQSKSGGALYFVTVRVEFDFVAAEDGSKHTVSTFGEAMDSSDKATNKAMSAAYKYAALQAFAIPTEADNDADLHTPEAVSQKPYLSPQLLERAEAAASNGIDAYRAFFTDLPSSAKQALVPKHESLKAQAEAVTPPATIDHETGEVLQA